MDVLAHNYAPLPVTIDRAEGVWMTATDGRRYLDSLSAYSAVNFGHRHRDLVAAAHAQLDRLTLTSRAFDNDQLEPFAAELTDLTQTEMMLPMNTGAEAVESALKLARAWGERVKGVRPGGGNIVTVTGNFHGRTTTIISLSDDPIARNGFGPYTPGFRQVPFGNAAAVAQVIDADTVAVLVEPVQGEAGVIIPPPGYLAELRQITAAANVLFIADEIQSGLGRTGATLETARQGVQPDLICLGKALGGGIVPVSAVVGRRDVIGVLGPGQHGSTFGGNPLSAAVGRAVVRLLRTGAPQRAARERGAQLQAGLEPLVGNGVTALRCVGLWAGVDIDPGVGSGRDVCLRLMERGVLAKDTHGQTVRLAPPLVIQPAEIDYLVDAFAHAVATERKP